MWFGVISIFPEIFQAVKYGIVNRALNDDLIQLQLFNPRDYTKDKHQTVDDRPYGGGPGMVMMAEPLLDTIKAAKEAAPTPAHVIYLSPQGKLFTQQAAEKMAAKGSIIFVAGRYEGIDERVIEQAVDEEWSIGDYILSGGELAAMVMLDSIARTIPGTVGDPESVTQDSLSSGLLKYPQYTRPEKLGENGVPSVLLSGNHQQINRWRLKQSLGRTWQKRPELLKSDSLNKNELSLLDEFIKESEKNSSNNA